MNNPCNQNKVQELSGGRKKKKKRTSENLNCMQASTRRSHIHQHQEKEGLRDLDASLLGFSLRPTLPSPPQAPLSLCYFSIKSSISPPLSSPPLHQSVSEAIQITEVWNFPLSQPWIPAKLEQQPSAVKCRPKTSYVLHESQRCNLSSILKDIDIHIVSCRSNFYEAPSSIPWNSNDERLLFKVQKLSPQDRLVNSLPGVGTGTCFGISTGPLLWGSSVGTLSVPWPGGHLHLSRLVQPSMEHITAPGSSIGLSHAIRNRPDMGDGAADSLFWYENGKPLSFPLTPKTI